MASSTSTIIGWPSLPEAGGPPQVSTARCISYDLGAVRRAVRTCVQALPDMQERFQSADRVLVKPNLLSSTHQPEEHVNTHPAFVQAVAELLIRDFGCEVAIGDSCGSLAEGSTARAIRNSQIDQVADDIGAWVYNVDTQPRHTVQVDQARVFREIPLPSNLVDFDLIVSVAKLKTHMLTGMTGAVKNIFGLVPGQAKKQAHMRAPRLDEFATLLCDLYSVIRPGAAFMDGIMAMEGRGPANGALRHVEMVAASCDGVALDSFCCQVVGLAPMEVPLLAQCDMRRLGTATPERIVVRGEPAEDFRVEGFALPPTYATGVAARIVPRWMVRAYLRMFGLRHAFIDQEACRQCGRCAENCPSHAIRLQGQRYLVDRSRCISCYCCAEVCPFDAIGVRDALPKRLWSRLKAPLRGRR